MSGQLLRFQKYSAHFSHQPDRESVKAEYEEDNEFVDRALAVAELIVEVCTIPCVLI